MKSKGFGNILKSTKMKLGALILILLGLCFFLYLPKIKKLKRIKVEINTLEKDIEKAQRIAKDFQPASREEEGRWRETQSRLYAIVPSEKGIPQLTYELAKKGRKYNISNISFISGKDAWLNLFASKEAPSKRRRRRFNRAPEKDVDISVFPGEETPSKRFNQASEIFYEDIAHFFMKLSFKTDYQYLAHFLEEIQHVDHFLENKYLIIKKDFPLISVELVIRAYYL